MRETLFERVLVRLDRWLERVQRERDLVARLMLEGQSTPMMHALLDELELELARVTALRRRLAVEREDPALLFSVRPRRALKVGLLPKSRRRVQAGREAR